MSSIQAFNGFTDEAIRFYTELAYNNNKGWFEEHKEIYKRSVIQPSLSFVEGMGLVLKEISSNLIADTRLNGAGSIFRIYRDIRFSKDKTPYKPYLGIFFWESTRKKIESAGFYFQLQPPKLMLSAGIYNFSKPDLETFRKTVLNEKQNNEINQIIMNLQKDGLYKIGGQHYEKVPRLYKENASNYLLKYNGLYAVYETQIPQEFYNRDLIDHCFEHFKRMSPIYNWLLSFIIRSV